MQRALSTHLFVNRRLGVDLLDDLERGGIPALEIFCARQHFDYTDAAQVRELAGWFAGHRLQLRSLHLPMYRDAEWGRSGARAAVNIAELQPVRRQESLDELRRALEVAERIPFRFAVQHVGVSGEAFDPRKLDAARASLDVLQAFARPRGVQLLVENIPNELSTPERLRELIDAPGSRELRVCFDTGHAHLGGGVVPAFERLRELVVSTHVHDNGGAADDHRFPFQGTIDWDATLRAFAAGPPALPLQFELRDHGEFARPLEKVLESFARLEELAAARTGEAR
jgi:sugar phosphate isomerase/epimerase